MKDDARKEEGMEEDEENSRPSGPIVSTARIPSCSGAGRRWHTEMPMYTEIEVHTNQCS
jgi:hypothetical protein